MLNDHGMYEHIMDDELFFGVVGMLECECMPLFTISAFSDGLPIL
jgi:hypothetical protein